MARAIRPVERGSSPRQLGDRTDTQGVVRPGILAKGQYDRNKTPKAYPEAEYTFPAAHPPSDGPIQTGN